MCSSDLATAIAVAVGCAGSPVHTLPKMTIEAVGAAGEHAPTTAARMAQDALRTKNIMNKPMIAEGSACGETAERFELIKDALSWGGGRLAREQVAHVEEDLHHQLVALVAVVQFLHSARLGRLLGRIERGLIDGLEIAEYGVAWAHDDRKDRDGQGVLGS